MRVLLHLRAAAADLACCLLHAVYESILDWESFSIRVKESAVEHVPQVGAQSASALQLWPFSCLTLMPLPQSACSNTVCRVGRPVQAIGCQPMAAQCAPLGMQKLLSKATTSQEIHWNRWPVSPGTWSLPLIGFSVAKPDHAHPAFMPFAPRFCSLCRRTAFRTCSGGCHRCATRRVHLSGLPFRVTPQGYPRCFGGGGGGGWSWWWRVAWGACQGGATRAQGCN